MSGEDAAERTEAPTPRRRQEAREEGQVARSTDLTAATVLLAALMLLNGLGPGLLRQLLELLQRLCDFSELDVGADSLAPAIALAAQSTALVLLPLLLLLLVVAAAGGLLQSGAVFSWKLLTPKLSHVDPAKGAKRIASLDSVTRLVQGLLKITLVAGAAYLGLSGVWPTIFSVGAAGAMGILHAGSSVVLTLALRLALVLLILGLADYFYQRWRFERNLMMTKQEIRDEMKRMDGDPLLKQRRRQLAMKLAMQRVQLDVPKADVIVTNPTEYAVAIRYDESTMAAPRVVAKGKDLLAARIRDVAMAHGIPIVQRPPLARALFAAVEVGHEIPSKYYRAVAEVLAFIYRAAGRAATA